MKVSLEWINDFIDIDGCKPEKIEEQLLSKQNESSMSEMKNEMEMNS